MAKIICGGLLFLCASGALAAPKPPPNVMVWGESWSVVMVKVIKDDDSLLGFTDCQMRVLFIKKSLNSPAKAKTILHEMFHAYTCEQGEVHNEKYNNTPGDEHPGIYFLEEVMADLFANNFFLINYVRDAMATIPPPTARFEDNPRIFRRRPL